MPFTKEAVEFLMENKFHDSRAWFEEHRKQYEQLVLEPMRSLVVELAPAVLALDAHLIAEPKVGRSLSRIYRDTRFTKDKSIFRDVAWCVFSRDKKAYEGPPAFFFEFSPSKLRWGCGFYRASPAAMDTMRGLIRRDDPDFAGAVEAVGADRYFVLTGDCYKRSKFPQETGVRRLWLDHKNISVVHECTEFAPIYRPELGQVLAADFKRLLPVYQFFRKAQTISFDQPQEETSPLPKAPRQTFDW